MAGKEAKKPANKKRSQWLDIWARLRRNKVFMVSLVIIVLLVRPQGIFGKQQRVG